MSAVPHPQTPDFALARLNMIEGQLRPNQVRDERILTAMETLPREVFVPKNLAGIAYNDEDLAVGSGRYLLEPMVLARLLQAAAISPTDHVLDIAPATGYSTALLAHLAKNVVAVESDAALAAQAGQNLAMLKIANAVVHAAPLTDGYVPVAPYDVILLNGAVDAVPESLLGQLAEGGRLVGVVRHYGPARVAHTGEARLYEKKQGVVTNHALFDGNVRTLPGFVDSQPFRF